MKPELTCDLCGTVLDDYYEAEICGDPMRLCWPCYEPNRTDWITDPMPREDES